MKAWSYSEYGAAKDVLTLQDNLPVPEVKVGEVLIAVKAAALNPVDDKRRIGKFKATDSPLPHVPGYDAAGVIVTVGVDVTKFKEGDEVYANVFEVPLNQPRQVGSLAQYTRSSTTMTGHRSGSTALSKVVGSVRQAFRHRFELDTRPPSSSDQRNHPPLALGEIFKQIIVKELVNT